MLFRHLDRLFTILNVFCAPIPLASGVSPCALICYISAGGHPPHLALVSLLTDSSSAQPLGQVSVVWEIVMLNGKVVSWNNRYVCDFFFGGLLGL